MVRVGTDPAGVNRPTRRRRRAVSRPGRQRVALAWATAMVVALVMATPPALAHSRPAGWDSGTLSDADLHSLVTQMTLTEEAGLVHGEGDPPNSAAANASCAAAAVGCVG